MESFWAYRLCAGCGADADEDRDRCPACGHVFEGDEPRGYGWWEAPPAVALRFFSKAHGSLAAVAAGIAVLFWSYSIWFQGLMPEGYGGEVVSGFQEAAAVTAAVAAASTVVWALTRPPRRSRTAWAAGVCLAAAYTVLYLVFVLRTVLGDPDGVALLDLFGVVVPTAVLASFTVLGARARGAFDRPPERVPADG